MGYTFYDHDGRAVAYTEDGIYIYLFTGEPVAYFDNSAIYSYSGEVLGWFVNGWIIDLYGYCVLFSDEASGGPLKPVKNVKPVKGVKWVKPIKSVKSVRPSRPPFQLSWPDLSGEEFFDR